MGDNCWYEPCKLPSEPKLVHIGNNVFIGGNSTILYDVKIGDNVIVGAGSVVTRDISSDKVVAGVPARIIGEFDNTVNKYISNNPM